MVHVKEQCKITIDGDAPKDYYYGMDSENLFNQVKAKAAAFPEKPGVYIMKDASKKVIYVGKATSLKSRTASYFSSGQKSVKTLHLVRKISDIEYILTDSEYEALLLEISLIKKWKPRYNISLRDGKTYPVIRITKEPFPRVFRTRRIIKDGSSYFGPYPEAKTIDLYLDIIKKVFPLRRCRILKKRDAPCLYYHIKQCDAPCCGKISEQDYNRYILRIRHLLNGRTAQFEKEVRAEMKKLAEELNFEKAARFRDALAALDQISSIRSSMEWDANRIDYIHYARTGTHFVFAVVETREGRITGQNLYRNSYMGTEQEAFSEFVLQYYSEREDIPGDLVVPEDIESENLGLYFNREKKKDVLVRLPELKSEKTLLKMAMTNAAFDLDRERKDSGNREALQNLQQVLKLRKLPKVIEGFDIAQLHGKFTVASLISFRDGLPDRKNYRHYKIQSLKGKIDDFKAISEAVSRRYTRLLNEEKSLPDLLMIDGGKGQVNAAHSVLTALGLEKKIPVIGLAKKEEIIHFPDERPPVDLPEGDAALRILQFVRDETHRFATSYNQKLRHKESLVSTLENIPGIGPAKSRKLMTTYGSLENIYEQTADEIARTAGVNDEVAEMVRAYLARSIQ